MGFNSGFKGLNEIDWEDVVGLIVAEHRDNCGAFVNKLKNFGFHTLWKIW